MCCKNGLTLEECDAQGSRSSLPTSASPTPTSTLAALSVAEPQPYLLRAATSSNELFGLMKRQSGYAPSSVDCGPGTTCAEACGPNYIQCPSDDVETHCFDPSIKEICCTDGSGCASSPH